MSRSRVVIVGAGLGGCVLAHALADSHEVIVVEPAADHIANPVIDRGRPALTNPHHAAGLGGTTKLWHSGLIEIEPEVFEAHWPLPHAALAPHYQAAFALLCGERLQSMREATSELHRRYRAAGLGLPDHGGLYYPPWPRNVWDCLGLKSRVRLVRGQVESVLTPGHRVGQPLRVSGVRLRDSQGLRHDCRADQVVLAAGGLGTPCLLQELSQRVALPALEHAGRHYEDHPMAFVGELELDAPLYKLWNFSPSSMAGNLRLPWVWRGEGLHVSFQLRPSARVAGSTRRDRVDSVLSDLRRRWWSAPLWAQVLRNRDDLLDILSFRFDLHLPTPYYTLLMVAQMPPSSHRAVQLLPADGKEPTRIARDWRLQPQYLQTLTRAIDDMLTELKPITRSARLFEGWAGQLRSAAHHSGTARLSHSPQQGVCTPEALVHGTANLHVCDGSLIPSSGVANTGLTIAALALRLAAHLKSLEHDEVSPAESTMEQEVSA